MPSEPMNIQEQGFRSSLFGFDKNDVLAYMNALANEAQQHELEYNRQLQQLQSKLDELRKPIYRQLAAYGHMGREDLGVKWENTDRVDALKAAVAE